MQLDLNRLYDVVKQISLDGYIEIVKLVSDDTVNVDLMDKGRLVGVYAKYSKEYLPLDHTIVLSSDNIMKVIRNLFKYNPIVDFTVNDKDILITNSDTSYVLKMRDDVINENVMKPKEFNFGTLPKFDRNVVATYTIDSDALSSIKTDEDVMEFTSDDKGLRIKFRYLEGESSRMFAGEKPNESFDVYFDASLISRISGVLNGKITVVIMKGSKAYQMMLGKVDKYYNIVYLLTQRVQ